MNRSRKPRWLAVSLLLGLTALVALASGPGVYADTVRRDTFHVVMDNTIPAGAACDFAVRVQFEADITVMTRFDNNGDFVVQTVHVMGGGRFTNTSTGASISFHANRIDRVTMEEDGSIIVAQTGLTALLNIPGRGHESAQIGRLVLRYTDPASPPEILFHAGSHYNPSPFPGICAYIS